MNAANSNNKQTIFTFTERINARDAEGLGELMSDDHTVSMRTAIRSTGEKR
jgi:hypothetical protein